jgi:trehalose 6-phosphate phosphatase
VAESSRSTDESLPRALELARNALAGAPAGLLTDFDGTLSPIVTDPALSQLVEGAHGALATLAERLAVVAIVTGRSPIDARRMAGVPGVLIAGNHGTEWLEPEADTPVSPSGSSKIRTDLDIVLARLPEIPGMVVEHKGSTASVHFRSAPDPEATLRLILDALGDVEEHGFRIGHGRKIVEIRPIGLGDKGSAVHEIVERYGLRGAVVMGDDITDLDMFRAVAELRDAGSLRGAIIGVAGPDGETPDEVAAAADVVLGDPERAAAFLAVLASD